MDTPKFKPGDKVRVTKAVGEAEVGTILTIRAPYYDTGWRFNEVAYYLEDKHIELVEDEPAQASASAFDVQVGGSHYKDMPIQPLTYIMANKIPFAEGNIIKYVSRWRKKNGLQDLKKARHILDAIIEATEKGQYE